MPANSVVVVTGAGGNLGAAIVRLLAERGHGLVAMERSGAALARAVDGLEPARILAEPEVDLGDAEACAGLVRRALDRFGRIDGLVNTVGTFAMGGIDDADPAQWAFLFEINLTTTLNMCRAVIPSMRTAGRGSIVNTGAVAALKVQKGMSAYAASKSAVLRLGESLADELKGDGVRVNTILPSIIDTPQNRTAMPKADVGKWVTPDQIAEVVAFLLSDAASGVTGAAIPISGRG